MKRVLLVVLALCLLGTTTKAQDLRNAFLSAANAESEDFDLASALREEERSKEGSTAAQVVIESVVAFPIKGETDVIVLRNLGGKLADMTGWTLRDSNSKSEPYTLGAEGCEQQAKLYGGEIIEIRPRTESNPCGFSFGISFRDEVSLLDSNGEFISRVGWTNSKQGTAVHRMEDGEYQVIDQKLDVIELLESLGEYNTFLKALAAADLLDTLKNASDPKYEGPRLPEPPKEEVIPQFPWWFGFELNRSALPPPPPPAPLPPPKEGLPSQGPYTILAPDDEAFDVLFSNLGGFGARVDEDEFLKLPEVKDILLYHILPGGYTSDYLKNNTAVVTAKAIEITPIRDPLTIEGRLMLHDSCIDKPTPDEFDCQQQVEFNKCFDPFMTSPFGAGWQGGFCERTCQRCTCEESTGAFCAEVTNVNLKASNGVVHTISRVLFPPPKFEKVVTVPSRPASRGRTPSRNDVKSLIGTRASGLAP